MKLILGIKDDDFNNILVDLCEKELKKKKGKSLDFYDTSNLIDQALKEWKKMEKDKLNSNKLKKVTFKEEKEVLEEEEDEKEEEANFTFQKIEDENLNEIKKIGGNKELNERIITLEKRLNDLEIRMDKFEGKNS